MTHAHDDASHDAEGADDLLCALSRLKGMEFAQYQQASLLRRVKYRMSRAGIVGFLAYRAVLEADPIEQLRLCETVPVLRTEFLRDPGA